MFYNPMGCRFPLFYKSPLTGDLVIRYVFGEEKRRYYFVERRRKKKQKSSWKCSPLHKTRSLFLLLSRAWLLLFIPPLVYPPSSFILPSHLIFLNSSHSPVTLCSSTEAPFRKTPNKSLRTRR